MTSFVYCKFHVGSLNIVECRNLSLTVVLTFHHSGPTKGLVEMLVRPDGQATCNDSIGGRTRWLGHL